MEEISMTYVMHLKRYLDAALMLSCLFAGMLHAVEPASNVGQPKLSVQYPTTELLLGESLDFTVRVVWTEPIESTVLAAKGLLAVEVDTEAGLLPHFSESTEYVGYRGKTGKWVTLSLAADNPVWEREIPLDYLYHISQPGSHRVTVHWIPAPLDSEKTERLLKTIQKDYPAKKLVLLESYGGKVTQNVTFNCPEREEDRAAYEFLAGGPCPETFLNLRMMNYPEPRYEELNERYPTCRYMGYVLPALYRSPYRPGHDLDPQDGWVRLLANGRYIREHPSVNIPQVGVVDTKAAIQARLEAYSNYLTANPGFRNRDRLEIVVGLDLLALGKTHEAAQHWHWIVDHGYASSTIESAHDYLAGLKRQGLLDEPENE
jgi:hypothetical protein